MKNHIKYALSALIVIVLILGSISLVLSADNAKGISMQELNNNAKYAAVYYLKNKFGEDYYTKHLSFREIIQISRTNAIGGSTDGVKANSLPANANQQAIVQDNNEEPLDYFMVIFYHAIKIGEKEYSTNLVSVILDPNLNVVRTEGVVDCVSNSKLCDFRITESEAIEIAKKNGVKGSKLDVQINYNLNFKKYIWGITAYEDSDAENGIRAFGKTIIIDSYDGKVLQISDFRESESSSNGDYIDINQKETVSNDNPNFLAKFWNWLKSLFG
ncbi:MAG: PepSY domain-containing protein [Nanoarchaeota archaeon]